MRILLDSHTALWWTVSPEKLKPKARQAISYPDNDVFISAVSLWELGLKSSRGKLTLPKAFIARLNGDNIESLSFSVADAELSLSLPPIHGDPFDRALIAQCRNQSLTFATRDQYAPDYGIAILEV